MQHRICDFTVDDLIYALASPVQSDAEKDEIKQELARRRSKENDQ